MVGPDPVSALKQALLEKGVQDPEILAKLAVIEKSTSDSTPTTITHKTVNQLKRAEKAFESTLAQIKELDEKWKIFSESLKTKFSEQGALYKAKRKQLVAKNTETKEKIGLLRQEIQKAAIKPEVEELPVDLLEEPELGEMKIDLTLASDSDEEAQSVSTEGSQVGSLDGEHGQQAMRPRFASLVNTILYDKEAPEHYVNFSAPLMGLRSWENKPWALHGGDFLDRSAHAFFQKLLATQTPKSPFEEVDPIRVSGEIQLMFAFPPELPHGDRVAGLFPELPLGDLAAGLSPSGIYECLYVWSPGRISWTT